MNILMKCKIQEAKTCHSGSPVTLRYDHVAIASSFPVTW
jgi:hypothetical protein